MVKLEVSLAPPKKRSPRWSQKRYDRFESLRRQIPSHYLAVVRDMKPIVPAFAEMHDRIKEADVTATQRKTLTDALWATREFVVMTFSRWQLYLPYAQTSLDQIVKLRETNNKRITVFGQDSFVPVTSHDVSVLRENGCNAWHSLFGRTEWSESVRPFYEDLPPEPLNQHPLRYPTDDIFTNELISSIKQETSS